MFLKYFSSGNFMLHWPSLLLTGDMVTWLLLLADLGDDVTILSQNLFAV